MVVVPEACSNPEGKGCSVHGLLGLGTVEWGEVLASPRRDLPFIDEETEAPQGRFESGALCTPCSVLWIHHARGDMDK